MIPDDLAHFELLADIDAFLMELHTWAARAPNWHGSHYVGAVVKRLEERASAWRVRFDAPLVVATLGGTGTGKSTLVNAIVGTEVTQTGRERPTTRQPVLICRPDLTPEHLGIDPAQVALVQRGLPALRDLALLDCPDPDTTEDPLEPSTNLARLRALLPHCDVLLVTTTQQKYRSAKVADELASAAPGARLVFVQTHAATDDDIRNDWHRQLSPQYASGVIFFVDSLAALADVQAGLEPRGDFARLLNLLSRELAGTAARRIRRANFLDLAAQTVQLCQTRIDELLPAIGQLERGLLEQRARLASRLSAEMRSELLGSRRPWEHRLLGEITVRWGFSPFSCLLRLYQGLGGLVSGAALLRARTPTQMALWGALEGGRRWRLRRRQSRAVDVSDALVSQVWDKTELRTATIILEGYAAEAGLPRDNLQFPAVERESAAAGAAFVEQASRALQTLVTRLASRHTGWWVRLRYETALLAVLGVLLYRFLKNFFYDSWLATELALTSVPQEVLGTDFLVAAAFILALWSGLLIWAYTARLRRGISAAINALIQEWNSSSLADGVFAGLEERCRAVRAFRRDLDRFQQQLDLVRQRVSAPIPGVGHWLGATSERGTPVQKAG